jgi:hypothetical protein
VILAFVTENVNHNLNLRFDFLSVLGHNAVNTKGCVDMKVGDYVTVQEIMNQSEARWVVLTDIEPTPRHGVKGGIVRCVAYTKREAGKVTAELAQAGVDTYLVSGSWEELVVGGVFVE